MSRIDAIDKKKFFETIDSYNFKETEALSQKLIDKNALTNDSIFRIGAKALTMINSIKDKTQLKNAFKPFMTWFDFCFKHQQKQTPKNSIIYYGIMFCKSLIQEQILDLADDLLNKLQDIYPFLCENKYDGETERYLKYLAPLCYNQAINKELINRDLDSAIKLFQHGIKFYIKVNTNFYVLFNSIRVFELNFIRTPKFEKFYDELFLFLKEPILSNECKNHIETQSFSMKFLLALFVQFRTTSFSNDIKINPKNENMYFDFLKNNFDNYNMKEIPELELGKDAVKIICLIKTYSAQFSQRKTANLLQENTQYEIQLNKKFTEMNKKCIELNKFFNYWLLANLFDLFVSSLSIFLNNLSMHPKFVTDSLVESFKSIADIYSNNSKQMFLTQNQIEIDTLSKSLFHKPIIFYNTVAKLIELKLKIRDVNLNSTSISSVEISKIAASHAVIYWPEPERKFSVISIYAIKAEPEELIKEGGKLKQKILDLTEALEKKKEKNDTLIKKIDNLSISLELYQQTFDKEEIVKILKMSRAFLSIHSENNEEVSFPLSDKFYDIFVPESNLILINEYIEHIKESQGDSYFKKILAVLIDDRSVFRKNTATEIKTIYSKKVNAVLSLVKERDSKFSAKRITDLINRMVQNSKKSQENDSITPKVLNKDTTKFFNRSGGCRKYLMDKTNIDSDDDE
ncbi:unnamed protein product [Brachionus calyciflorus]|uniref:Uncharacterized protein n=1 Tax=Brachionus calyciflorus TaxID=104777 RepID=A0A813M2F0_9BILA|nr:unnamed protein product [Brachionus calyciflorus]